LRPAQTTPQIDSSWTKPAVYRPFLQPSALPERRAVVRRKPAPHIQHVVLPVQQSREPFVAFLNGLSPGLGEAAPVLHTLGIKSEADLKRMKAEWWSDYCRTEVRSCLCRWHLPEVLQLATRGLAPLDECLLAHRILRYLEQLPPPTSSVSV
jgi:hypothetical protein